MDWLLVWQRLAWEQTLVEQMASSELRRSRASGTVSSGSGRVKEALSGGGGVILEELHGMRAEAETVF